VRRQAGVIYAVVVCLSVCLSVTFHCSTEMAKHRITQTMLHDSRGTLVSNAKDLVKTEMGSPPTEAKNAGGHKI